MFCQNWPYRFIFIAKFRGFLSALSFWVLPHLHNGRTNSTYLMELLWGRNKLIHEKHAEESLAHSNVCMMWVMACLVFSAISHYFFAVFFADFFSLLLLKTFALPWLYLLSFCTVHSVQFIDTAQMLAICKYVFFPAHWYSHFQSSSLGYLMDI
jgi:hypothetical protein